MKVGNNQLSGPQINISQEQFVLKNINLRLRKQAGHYDLNFNSTLLYALCLDRSVKIILCFACNGKLKLLNNLQIDGEYIKSMRQHNGFILIDTNTYLHIYSYSSKQVVVLKNTKFLYLSCDFLFNKKDDLLISSTVDSKLKFWDKFHDWECHTIDTVSQIMKLCLNEEEDKLVALRQRDICVYQKQLNNWVIIQVIRTRKGKQVCFIKNNMLVVLVIKKYNYVECSEKGKIKTYGFDQFTNSFQFLFDTHVAGDQIDDGFDEEIKIDFIKEKNQLFVRIGNYVNIFKINENRELIIQQKIRFFKKPFYESRMLPSQRGEFLAYNYQLQFSEFIDSIQIKRLRKHFD